MSRCSFRLPDVYRTRQTGRRAGKERNMAVRKIRVLGDEILRKACKPVPEMTPRNAQLIEDMFDTM